MKDIADEVDLGLVYNKIKQLFLFFWNSFTFCFFLIIRKWIFLLIFLVVGAGLGTASYYYTKPVYASTLVLSSNALSNEFCADLINNLNVLVKDKTPELLAKKLNITISSAQSIKEIEFENYNEKLKKKYEDKDSIVLGLPFKIKVYAYTTTIFDTLNSELVNYLENNKYSLIRKKIKVDNINKLRQKIATEIYQIDSLKFVVSSNLFPRGNQSGFVFGQPIDPMNMFKEGITLFKEDLDLSTSLILSENIQVIQDFSPRAKPDSPRLTRNIFYYGAGAFMLGLFFSFYQERKKILPQS